MKSLAIFVVLTALIATTARADTYSAKPEGCTNMGWDTAVKQTRGPYAGMYRCFCNSIAKGAALDAQYELLLANAQRFEIVIKRTKTQGNDLRVIASAGSVTSATVQVPQN